MTGWRKRQVMEMAREVKMPYDFVTSEPINLEKLEVFAELVRADERNRTWTQEHWTEYERSIAALEREACAKVAENTKAPFTATAIRARGMNNDIANNVTKGDREMTRTEKAIRDYCGHRAEWWPSAIQVQAMLALAQDEFKPDTCPNCAKQSPLTLEWVGLNGDEVNHFAAGCHLGNSVQGAIRKAEAKLKEKNR